MAEPYKITAGTLVEWNRPDEYAHGLWTFTYHLIGPSKQQISTSADAGIVEVTLRTADTTAWPVGRYQWFLMRENGGDQVKVDEGFFTVAENPLGAAATVDTSTHAERMLAAIEARLEGRAKTDYENYSIDGRAISRIPVVELDRLRIRYANKVRKEKIARGEVKPFRGNVVRLR